MTNYVANAVANLVTAYRLRPAASGGFAYNTPTLYPGGIGDDFSAYATIAEAKAGLRSLFPSGEGFFTEGSESLDSTITLNGHATWRVQSHAANAFYAEKSLTPAASRVWARSAWRLSANHEFGTTLGSVFAGWHLGTADYSTFETPSYQPRDQWWQNLDFDEIDVYAEAATALRANWIYPVFMMDEDGTTKFFREGVCVKTLNTTPAGLISLIGPELRNLRAADADSYVNYGLIEFVIDEEDPYGLL